MKPSSVTDMLKKLAEKKFINYEKYKGTSLTKRGRLIALSIIRKHRLWETFLVEKLGFGWDQVHIIAEQLEHIKSEEDYLKALYHLEMDFDAVSTNSIAGYLEMKPSSVTDMLKKLAEKNFINYQKYKGTSLTKKGKLIALSIIRKHRLWETFLVEKLGFGWDQVHIIAEQLEHIKSEELIENLDNFLGNPKYDPHGDPIPNKDGEIEKMNQKLLVELKASQKGIITGVKKGTASLLNYLDKEKVKLGDSIKVIEILEFDGTYIVEINKRKLTFSEKICQNLLLETND
jgi:DtxR family Mn-dependent transcriptional regulator